MFDISKDCFSELKKLKMMKYNVESLYLCIFKVILKV